MLSGRTVVLTVGGSFFARRAAALLLGAGALTFAPLVQAQERSASSGLPAQSSETLEELTLEDLLDTPVMLTSRRPLSARRSPGIVTVVTRNEIVASGARDLVDVLQRVPGFAFGTDVAGVVGAGIRGVWGHEGKILLLIDGQELNETLYSTTVFGHEFPVDQIERIEIIRGPGSAMYGGYAGLGVINVITRSDDASALYVSGTGGLSGSTVSRSDVGFHVGHRVGGASGVGISLGGFIGEGLRSTGTYRDIYGTEFAMADASELDPRYLNLSVRWRGLQFRAIHSQLGYSQQDSAVSVRAQPLRGSFTSDLLELKYDVPVTGQLMVVPRLSFKRQQPWRVLDAQPPAYYDKSAYRLLAGMHALWNPDSAIHVLAGLEGMLDHARLDSEGQAPFASGDSVSYRNAAAFAEVSLQHELVDATAGARYELHSAFGSSFVPRAALTRAFGPVHAKLLFANAFRAPGIENINLGMDVKPERTTVFEAEVGVQATDFLFLAVNAFDVTLDQPLIYLYDPESNTEGYANHGRTGTRGLEAEARVMGSAGFANLSYSFYTPDGKNAVGLYAVPERGDVLLGFAGHKVALNAGLQLPWGLSLNPSGVWFSRRFGTLAADAEGNATVGKIDPLLLLNLFATKRDLGVKGLGLSVGVHNLLDTPDSYVQPYNGWHAPLPGMGREVQVRLSYELGLGE